jgi:hypothetical protein
MLQVAPFGKHESIACGIRTLREALWQLPADKGSILIQRPRHLLE